MTDAIRPQPSSIGSSLLKPFIGLFHFLLPMAVMSSFAFAAIMTPMVFLIPLPGLLIELVLISFTLLGGTYQTRHIALKAQAEARERLRMKQAAGTPSEFEEVEAANAEIPAFNTLLRRNLLICAFYIPLIAVTSLIFYGLLTGSVFVTREVAQSRTGAEVMLRILIPLAFFGWLAVIFGGWTRIAKFVDRRLLKTEFELPVDEETRQKNQEREALQGDRTIATRFRNMLFSLGGSLLGLVTLALPLFLIPALLGLTGLPENIKVLVLVVVMLAYCFGLLIAMPRLLRKWMNRSIEKALDEAAKDPEIINDPEALKELEAARAELRSGPTSGKTTESLMMDSMFKWFFILVGVFMVIAFGLAFVARSQGMDGEGAKGVFAIALLVGIVIAFVVLGKIVGRIAPKSAMMSVMAEYEAAIRGGDYATLIPMVDRVMAELPNWESKIPGAAAYAQAGHLDEAERITRDVLQELSSPQTEVQREMFKPLLGQAFGLLAEILIGAGRMNEVEEALRYAREYGDDGYPINNTIAKVHLLRGDGKAALPYIEKAAQGYVKAKQPVSPYNQALRAWALALQGNSAQADTLMMQAFAALPAAYRADQAELYMLGGYIAIAQRKSAGARKSFERAIALDAEGVNGKMALRALQTV